MSNIVGYIQDVEGNQYDVVKIGLIPQYWLTTNLKTTKYNNGESISSSHHVKFADEALQDAYGHFYRIHDMTTSQRDRLAPKGCEIPLYSDWSRLVTICGNLSAAAWRLKGPRKEPDDHPRWPESALISDALNGFNAYPGGGIMNTFTDLGQMTGEDIENIGTVAHLWSRTRKTSWGGLYTHRNYVSIFSNNVMSITDYTHAWAYMPLRCIVTDIHHIVTELDLDKPSRAGDPLFFGAGF